MDKQRLNQLWERYDQRANKASDNYQETGISRYLTDYHNYSELADIIALALGAADEHNELMSLKSTMAELASRSERGDDISSDLLKVCIGRGIYRKL